MGKNGTTLQTTNGGNNWNGQGTVSTDYLYSVSFIDENIGTAVGYGYPSGTILRTTNGGNTWSVQSSGMNDPFDGINFFGVSFTDANNGTIVGDDGIILRTTDGGQNWNPQTSGTINPLRAVCFTDANTGIVVGGDFGVSTILRTTDGGQNWVGQTNPGTNSLLGVSFTDANNGTAVGQLGTILRTTDGGNNWISQPSNTANDLYGVHFTDSNNGTAVGAYGAILRTTNGGGVPVELTSFTANVIGTEVILNWTTATEINNQGFDIERKNINDVFEKIGFVSGFGTTTEPKAYLFIDKNVMQGTYSYRLKQIDFDRTYEYSNIIEVAVSTPEEFSLSQNYPNPFNPTTTIGFGINEKTNVKISVLNTIGEEVAIVLNEEKESGYHTVKFNAADLPSGVYFYQIRAGSFVKTKKMILLR